MTEELVNAASPEGGPGSKSRRIDYIKLQKTIDAHPEGITSQMIAEIMYGNTDTATVTLINHSCIYGIDKHILKICKRRANMSTYAMWYPESVRGKPMTELEKCAAQLGTFTPRQLSQAYQDRGVYVGFKGYSKMEKYLQLMEDDGSVERTGNPYKTLEYRWVG